MKTAIIADLYHGDRTANTPALTYPKT